MHGPACCLWQQKQSLFFTFSSYISKDAWLSPLLFRTNVFLRIRLNCTNQSLMCQCTVKRVKQCENCSATSPLALCLAKPEQLENRLSVKMSLQLQCSSSRSLFSLLLKCSVEAAASSAKAQPRHKQRSFAPFTFVPCTLSYFRPHNSSESLVSRARERRQLTFSLSLSCDSLPKWSRNGQNSQFVIWKNVFQQENQQNFLPSLQPTFFKQICQPTTLILKYGLASLDLRHFLCSELKWLFGHKRHLIGQTSQLQKIWKSTKGLVVTRWRFFFRGQKAVVSTDHFPCSSACKLSSCFCSYCCYRETECRSVGQAYNLS